MAMLPGITEVIAFGSGAFVAVCTLVNYLQARDADRRSERVIAWASASAAAAAIGVLAVELARDDPVILVAIATLALMIAGLVCSSCGAEAPPSRAATERRLETGSRRGRFGPFDPVRRTSDERRSRDGRRAEDGTRVRDSLFLHEHTAVRQPEGAGS